MKEFSREMRKNPTDAENKLWQELRGKKLGFGFRRQFVIDSKYIADFVCLEKRLIIECDGGQHNQTELPNPKPLPQGEGLTFDSPSLAEGDKGGGYEKINHPDIQRDFYLESQNFRILRFWNNEILENLEGVLLMIKNALESDFANAKFTHPLTPSAREGDESLAQIYHYDLYGKRKDKYAFLQSNGLDSIAWNALTPKAPFYLFIPQNESLRTEYDKGISVKDIFKVSGAGIVSGKDDFCISKSDSEQSLQELKNNIAKFMNLDSESARKEFDLGNNSKSVWQIQKAKNDLEKTNNNPNNYIKIQYRPFDLRWTYYTSQASGFLGRPRYEVMKHFLPSDSSLRGESKSPLPCGGGLVVGKSTAKSKHTPPLAPPARGGEQMGNPQNENVGFIYKRGFPNAQSGHCFATNTIIDFRSWSCAGMQGGDYIAPLYLIESDSRIENFTQSFRAFIDAKYGESYAPEVILGYIYAILYHKDYREKYLDFLKIDFPKVPFVKSKKDFLALSALGCALVDLHLMRVDLSGESVGEPLFSDLSDKNERIDKIAYNAENKRLFVNASLYFDKVSAEVWEYKIGGYAVLDKYLKSHKGESINYTHFERIIKTLHKSLEIEAKIAGIGIN